MKKIELLSPAGNIEKAKWALLYGSDAVYIGGQEYSLRANTNNFSLEEIKEIVNIAHNENKKIYVTCNIIFHNKDFDGFKQYITKLGEFGVDAIIVADISAINIIRKYAPSVEVHISTQQSSLNYESIKFYEKLGATRVVLGREASKEDIKLIKEKTNMEIEVFIHGAMCSALSGRCVLSNYFTNRDSNRGGCSQVCRFAFNLFDESNAKINSNVDYAFASKDLSLLKYLNELIELGVDSLKIEGRMRSNYYIASVLHVYRRNIDAFYNNNNFIYNPKDENLLLRCSNREAVPQFFDKFPKKDEQYYSGRMETTNQDFLAVVLSYNEKEKIATITQRNYFSIEDKVVVFGPTLKEYEFVIREIINSDNKNVEKANHPEEILKIPLDIKVEANFIIRKQI
ncbi:MAG: peptidase U32 family protein [Bacilli bacterium]